MHGLTPDCPLQEVLELGEEAEQVQEWRRLQRGWYLGSDSFRDRLMDRVEGIVAGRKRVSYRGEGLGAHDEREAARLLAAGLDRLGLTAKTVLGLKKTDPRKQALAWLIKTRTVMRDEWVGARLQMGHRSNISRAVSVFQISGDRERDRLRKVLHTCTD
jgi:hypothetical protein